MKAKFLLILILLLISNYVSGQEYLLLENTSLKFTGAVLFGHTYSYGKLEFSAFSEYWTADTIKNDIRTCIGFLDSLRYQEHIFLNGIVVRNGYLCIFKNCPDTTQTCNNMNSFKKKIPIPKWNTINSDTNNFILSWFKNEISLAINDTIHISDITITEDNIPQLPLHVGAMTDPTDTLTIAKLIYYLSTTDIKEISDRTNLVKNKFFLNQNYPNPFNNETLINYQIPYRCNVTISVYNTLGQNIRTLLQDNLSKGFHQIKWDGKDYFGNTAPSGIYYLLLKSDKTLLNRKMLFIQ